MYKTENIHIEIKLITFDKIQNIIKTIAAVYAPQL